MNTHNLVYVIRSLKRLWVKEMSALSFNPVDQAAEQFRNTLSKDIQWSFNGRFERGITLAKQGAVSPRIDPYPPDKHRQFQVKSANQSQPNLYYLVDLDAGTCDCPDHLKGHFCKHRIAAHIMEWVQYNRQKAVAASVQSSSTTYALKDNQAQQAPVVSEQVTETSLETLPPTTNNAVIWGAIKHGGQWLGVEVLAMQDEKATIRALPKIIGGNKLQPQFPFDGKRCTTTIPKKHLFHVKIFQ
jgi:hypothetical protein